MPASTLARFCLLPDLKLTEVIKAHRALTLLRAKKVSPLEVCPKCATPSSSIYDHRSVRIKDAPLRNKHVGLIIRKRRFWCKTCHKPFTEPVSGVGKGKRYTQRFKAHVLWACENFSDLKSVRRHVNCSYGFIYAALYEQLELNRRRHNNYPWPKIVGFDEHRFKKNKQFGYQEFVSFVIDHKNKKAFEVVKGRSALDLHSALNHIPGRENVLFVTMDLSPVFRFFTLNHFPNAQIVADKFHVIRLLHPAINRRRKEITGDKRKLGVRFILLKNGRKLKFETRLLLYRWLNAHPQLREIYEAKEAIQRLYRIRGYHRAEKALHHLLDTLGKSRVPEVITFRRTLKTWSREILCYFKTGLTNARVEGFNNKAKVIKKRAYGYRNFTNYRLRLLHACS